MENETGKLVSVEKNGPENRVIISWDTKRKYTSEQKAKQREEFTKAAQDGQLICLSSLMITHGM